MVWGSLVFSCPPTDLGRCALLLSKQEKTQIFGDRLSNQENPEKKHSIDHHHQRSPPRTTTTTSSLPARGCPLETATGRLPPRGCHLEPATGRLAQAASSLPPRSCQHELATGSCHLEPAIASLQPGGWLSRSGCTLSLPGRLPPRGDCDRAAAIDTLSPGGCSRCQAECRPW